MERAVYMFKFSLLDISSVKSDIDFHELVVLSDEVKLIFSLRKS